MAKQNRRAGQNIRTLATKRRIKAILSLISAGLVIFFPFILIKFFDNLLKQISSLSSTQTQTSTLQFPIYFYSFFVIVALSLILNSIYLWQRANHAAQGAKGEEDMAQEMTQLEQEGWRLEYEMLLGARLGDADIVCMSPKGRAYVIDVKSHRGEVFTNGKYLHRRMGSSTYEFEKDFLERTMKQALQVKKQKGLNFVTPIVAFSEARVSVPAGKLRGVYVVEKARLLFLLRTLG